MILISSLVGLVVKRGTPEQYASKTSKCFSICMMLNKGKTFQNSLIYFEKMSNIIQPFNKVADATPK